MDPIKIGEPTDSIVERFTRREIDREAMVKEHLAIIAILVNRAGGEVTIPFREIRELPPLELTDLVTRTDIDAVVIKMRTRKA